MSKLWLTNFLSILPLHKQWSFPLRIWSHLLNKSLMQNFIFCALILVFWNLPLFFSNYRRTREGIEQKGNTRAIAKLKAKLFSSNFQPSKTKSYSKPVTVFWIKISSSPLYRSSQALFSRIFIIFNTITAWRMSKFRVCFGPYFPAFGRNSNSDTFQGAHFNKLV